MHAHAVAVNANLQASAMSQGSSFVKAHAPHSAFHSSSQSVGRLTCPPSRHDDVVVTLAPATPAHSAGAVNSTADVLDLMQDDDDDERYTSVTVTESPAATIPAELSTAISGKVARSFRSFEDARTYVRTLGLKSWKEWHAWSKSGARPHDIPSTPNVTYASSGWLSYGDFLGYAVGKQAQKRKESKFRSFEDARTYVRTLGLKSAKEWEAWKASGKRPCDIPSHPQTTYKQSGWLSYGDFLGFAEGKVSGSFRSFEDARAYVRTLGLKSVKEWQAWSKSARPHDIPGTPNVTYASSGWTSYGDFLGFARGKVTGAYKRNAAVASLRALHNDADNDEKDEQDGVDEDARRRKQAKRPRGG
ncbi:methyltransferase domain-containing protein [Pycnococcus provasolii]